MKRTYSSEEASGLEQELNAIDALPLQDRIERLEILAKDHPDFSFAQSALGDAYWSAGELDKAVASFERAFLADPNRANVCLSLAQIFAEKKDKSNMLLYLGKMAEIEKNRVEQYKKDGKKNWTTNLDLVWSDADYNRFKPYHDDPDFIAVYPPPKKFPEELTVLFEAIKDDNPNLALKEGERLLREDYSDKLVILEALKYVLKKINSDLDEHGEGNLQEYDPSKSLQYYRDYEKEISRRIFEAKERGETSNIFKEFFPN